MSTKPKRMPWDGGDPDKKVSIKQIDAGKA